MRSTRAGIRSELVAGIFLLSLLSAVVSFVVTVKVIEQERIASEVFNMQRIFFDLAKEQPETIAAFKLYLPASVQYSLLEPPSMNIIRGRELINKSELPKTDAFVVKGKGWFYPNVTIAQPVYIGQIRYVLLLRYEFDIDRAKFRNILIVFVPFALANVLIITGFAFAMYRNRIVKPYQKLRDAFESVSGGETAARVSNSGIQDWDVLYGQFNYMMDRLVAARAELETTIDELSATNTALIQARNDVVFSEKMATVGRLAAGLAHEIGNPLTSVIGYMSYMHGNAHTDEERDMLAMVMKEADRINHIIRDLLDFARTKPVSDELTVCNARDVIDETVRLLIPQCDAKSVSINTESLTPAVVRIIAEELKQVMINLVINALDVTPDGGSITIGATICGGAYSISVSDSGGGIPDDIRDKIFEPFFTTKGTGKGTGLGLSVVHTLVNRNGGTVEFDSDESGTVFTVTLDAVETQDA